MAFDEKQQRFLRQYGEIKQGGQQTSAAQDSTYQTLMGKAYQPPVQQFDQNAYQQQLQGQVNSMYDAQKQSQISALQASRNKALGQLNEQKAQLAPQYQGMRNQTDVVNMQQVNKLKELMAANGLNASGENLTAQTNLGNQRQNSLNSLNLQEQQANNSIDRQIADVNDPYQEQSIIAALEAQRSRALLDASNRAEDVGFQRQQYAENNQRYYDDRDYSRNQNTLDRERQARQDALNKAYQDAQLTGIYNGQKTMDAINADRGFALNEAGVTGIYNGKQTFQSQQAALEEAWRQKQWNQMSPAEKQQLQLQYEYAMKKAAKSGGGSIGGGTSYSPYPTLNAPQGQDWTDALNAYLQQQYVDYMSPKPYQKGGIIAQTKNGPKPIQQRPIF